MSKQEFLDGLRRSLAGGMEPQKVQEHISYYSEYIDTQIRMGISEEAIMTSLGEPRLIAKTLLEMEAVESKTEEYVEQDNVEKPKERFFEIKGRKIRIPQWLFTILICIICFCVLTVLFAFITKVMPILLLIGLGVFLFRKIRNFFG